MGFLQGTLGVPGLHRHGVPFSDIARLPTYHVTLTGWVSMSLESAKVPQNMGQSSVVFVVCLGKQSCPIV